jgi:protein-S-isoprenylcysteine O-methyltransferase Ste14
MLITLTLLWILWCTLHSLLITERVQKWVTRQDNWLTGSYRLLYVLFSLLSLIPILVFQYSLPQKILFAWQGWWHLPRLLLLVYALVLFRQGSKNYDIAYFLGFRQWQDHKNGRSTPALDFRCEGIGLYLRHPWYSGGLAILWALEPVTDVNLPARLILTGYLILGTLLEERKLRRQLGRPYQQYCRQVPMLFPWKGKVSVELTSPPPALEKKRRNLP